MSLSAQIQLLHVIEHIRHLRTSGTVISSSPFLVSRLLRDIDFAHAQNVVQLGVGTGCITRALLKRMRPDARLVAFELNPVFVEHCRDIADERLVLIEGCAGSMRRILAGLGMAAQLDCVVSSLPLSIMNRRLVARILRESDRMLRKDGVFLQYQYSLSQLSALEQLFGDVKVGFTLANLPPAFVYECHRCQSR